MTLCSSTVVCLGCPDRPSSCARALYHHTALQYENNRTCNALHFLARPFGCDSLRPAFPLRKFFKESLTHGPLNLCANEKTVRVNDSPYFQFWSHTVPPAIPIKIIMSLCVIRRAYHLLRYISIISN